MSEEKDLKKLNLRSSRRKEFSDMSGHSTSSRTPLVLKKKKKKKCIEKPENEKEKVEKNKKGPKTGPLPASSMPIMQGLDAHLGRGASDSILFSCLFGSPRRRSLSKEAFSDFPPQKQLAF
jgi:hypothetical protein